MAEEILNKNNIKLIYEDNHIIVVIKPAGIPSQRDKSASKDMLNVIKMYLKEKWDKKGDVYLGLVHRLDRMTSGIMVFAKTSKAASRLCKNIREGDFKKKYLAAVNGKIENEDKKCILEDYLLKDERNNTSKVVKENDKNFHNAKKAKLKYNVVCYSKEYKYTYVDVELFTGRSHQIRIQFANIGHPLYGDVKYGENINKVGHNLALFAYSLSFPHPTKDEWMDFKMLPEKNGIWSDLQWN